jgi:hypothetical protein
MSNLTVVELASFVQSTSNTLPTLASVNLVETGKEKIFSRLRNATRETLDAFTRGTQAVLLRTGSVSISVSAALIQDLEKRCHTDFKDNARTWTPDTGGVVATAPQTSRFEVLWNESIEMMEVDTVTSLPEFKDQKGAKKEDAALEAQRANTWAALTVTAVAQGQAKLTERYCTAFADTIARLCKATSWDLLVQRYVAATPAVLWQPILPVASLDAALDILRLHTSVARRLKMECKAYAGVIRYGAFASGASALEQHWKEQFAKGLSFDQTWEEHLEEQWTKMAAGLLEKTDSSLLYLSANIPAALAKKGGARINSLVTPSTSSSTPSPQLAVHCPRCGGAHLLKDCAKANTAIYAAPAVCTNCKVGHHWKIDCPKG